MLKFLAMLEDSLREAIDTKVFTVLVGLSIMAVAVAASASFVPDPGRQAVEQIVMAAQLSDPPGLGAPVRGGRGTDAPPVAIRVLQAEPLDGAPDSPSSPFRLRIEAFRRDPGPAGSPGAAERTVELIREHLGAFGDKRAFDVTEVRRVAPAAAPAAAPGFANLGTHYEVHVRPTRDTLLFWPHQTSVFFGALDLSRHHGIPLGSQLFGVENYAVNGVVAWIAILLGVVVTAFFVPNMLRKGAVDLLLVRPLHRVRLLLFKYLGGVVFMGLTFAALFTAVWLVLGLRTGIWRPGFLLGIPTLTCFFAILYAVSALYGVLTRSPIVSILLTCVVWFGLFLVGFLYHTFETTQSWDELDPWVPPTLKTLHAVLPRTKELDYLMGRTLGRELLSDREARLLKLNELPGINWNESLGVSAAFVGVVLGLACWRFHRKDY